MSIRFGSQITIDCMLSKGVDGLRGDGCVYELSTSRRQVSNPSKLRAGDYVKVRLWLPDESDHLLIDLAEIQWIKDHWIKVEIISISAAGQVRLKRFMESQGQYAQYPHPASEQILIRA